MSSDTDPIATSRRHQMCPSYLFFFSECFFRSRSTVMIQALRRPTMVIAGTGMAGAKIVEEVLNREPGRFNIRMFGAEPHGTYNRILLSGVLGGFQDPE